MTILIHVVFGREVDTVTGNRYTVGDYFGDNRDVTILHIDVAQDEQFLNLRGEENGQKFAEIPSHNIALISYV